MRSVEVRKAINALDVANQAAAEILVTLGSVLSSRTTAHIALTGGTVGILTLEVLSKMRLEENLDFSKVHFWWSDERFVSSDSPDRNSNQAKSAFLASLDISNENIHEFPASDGGLDLESARQKFDSHLLEVFGSEQPKMDLTLLGMGGDGHIASLFPGKSSDEERIVAVDDSPKPPAQRLSFSMGLINASDRIIFTVAGIDKAEAIDCVHKNPDCDLPAAKVSAQGQTLWIIDEAAGASFWSC